MNILPEHKPEHKSICAFVKHNVNETEINYPRDCKNFLKLWEKFPDFEFWSKHFHPYESKYALHAYLGAKGTDFIKKQWNLFLLEKVEKTKEIEYNLNKPAVEEINVSKRKPRTIKEFLRYNYEQK